MNSGKIGRRRRESEEELTKKRRGGSERLWECWNNGTTVRFGDGHTHRDEEEQRLGGYADTHGQARLR
jgi:hypothetical protein